MMEKVCAAEVSTPPLVVPPLSCARTDTVTVPQALAAGVKVSVPFAARTGCALKRFEAVLLVMNVSDCADSLAGPTEMPVAKAANACAPASSATVTAGA